MANEVSLLPAFLLMELKTGGEIYEAEQAFKKVRQRAVITQLAT